jgi:hypothetical protein
VCPIIFARESQFLQENLYASYTRQQSDNMEARLPGGIV